MPKFLDRPQWFDDLGEENFASGIRYIEVDNGDTITINSASGVSYLPGRYYLKWVGDRGSTASISFSFTGGTIPLTFSYSPSEEALGNCYGLEAVYFDLYVMNNKIRSNSLCYVVFHNVEIQNQRGSTIDSSALFSVSYGSLLAITSTGSTTTIEKNPTSIGINGTTSFSEASFYAPISNPAGGKILQSNGSNAPQWADFKINNAALGTSTSSIYAPTSGGTSGYLLASGGSTSTPVWRSIQSNGSQLGGGMKTFYAPTTQGTAGQILTSSGVSSGPPVWKSFTKLYQHNLHLTFALNNNTGNVVYFSIITSNPDSYTTVLDAFQDAYEKYNNATMVATGTVYFPGLIYSMWMNNSAYMGINYMNLSSNSVDSTTRMYTGFTLQRDYVVPVFA